MAGAVILGAPEEAEAANGDAIRLGKPHAASVVTSVAMSGKSSGLVVTSSNAASTAHALVGTAKGGSGLIGSSTGYHGAKVSTASPNHHGLMAQNLATAATDAAKGCAIYAQHLSNVTSNPPTVIRAVQGANAEQTLATLITPGAGEFAGAGYGVVGASTSPNRAGVVGFSGMQSGIGVWAYAVQSGGTGLRADGPSGADSGYALYAAGRTYLKGPTSIFGNLTVSGTVSKQGGSFLIDHPLDPANKYLSHSFVESPDMMNVYNGNVVTDANGEAVVELPEWFETLNKDFRYQLTPLGSAAPNLHVKAKISDGRFSISGAKPGQEISWQVTGIRQDAWANKHRIPVEHDKPKAERGRYLFPGGFGASEDQNVFQPPRDLVSEESR